MLTPIIMESEIEEVAKKLKILRDRGDNRVHFDIGDGMFSEWLGVAPSDLQGQNLGGLGIDFHLLVDDPTEWIEECVALEPERIIGQIERMGTQEYFLQTIKDYGRQVRGGLALSIDTPIEELSLAALREAAVVLLLSVPSGTAGSKFDPRVVDKIKQLKKIYQGPILIDGGIDAETQAIVIEAGATEVGANSNYWKGKI